MRNREHLRLFHLDPHPAHSPIKDQTLIMSLGVCMVFPCKLSRAFGGVRCEVRADLRVLMLKLTSCVYRFPLHLLGLQNESTEGLSTGEPRGEQNPQQIHVKEHVNTSLMSAL